ncbi:AAA family ATPase [Candidatus Dojkabacteria bacterium]|nr:AAA family ATPase [Candidatus Dojkabacteria bacterium]
MEMFKEIKNSLFRNGNKLEDNESFSIKKATIGSKDIKLSPNSIVIITGENGAGKTTLLNEISRSIKTKIEGKILTSVELNDVKPSNLETYFSHRFSSRYSSDWGEFWVYKGGAIAKKDIEAYSNNPSDKYLTTVIEDTSIEKNFSIQDKNVQDIIENFKVEFLDTTSRLEITLPKDRYDMNSNETSEHIHILQKDKELLENVSEAMRKTFGKGIVINQGGSKKVWFHYGEITSKNISPISSDYLTKLNKLPLLHQQGDGIKAFMGILLSLYCGKTPYLFIDEPDLFLHPPQARQLGELVATSASSENKNRQIFLATHSKDFIEGLINTGSNVTLVRLGEKNSKGDVTIYESNKLKNIGSRDFLKFSESINGLFYKGIVLCEGGDDLTYYKFISKLYYKEKNLPLSKELFFINCGGKSEIVKYANLLRELDINFSIIFDIDILRSKDLLKKLRNLYIEFPSTKEINKTVAELEKKAYEKINKTLNFDSLKKLVKKFHDSIDQEKMPDKKDVEDFNKFIGNKRKWKVIKGSGSTILTGHSITDWQKLIENFKKLGIFIVPVGELESWDKKAGSKNSSNWIENAIDGKDEEFLEKNKELNKFIKYLFQFHEIVE